MSYEELRVLKDGSMFGIRVHDELGVGKMLREFVSSFGGLSILGEGDFSVELFAVSCMTISFLAANRAGESLVRSAQCGCYSESRQA